MAQIFLELLSTPPQFHIVSKSLNVYVELFNITVLAVIIHIKSHQNNSDLVVYTGSNVIEDL